MTSMNAKQDHRLVTRMRFVLTQTDPSYASARRHCGQAVVQRQVNALQHDPIRAALTRAAIQRAW